VTTKELTNKLMFEVTRQFQARVRRRNVGVSREGGRYIPFGHPGEADITGIIAPAGICLEIEIKNGKDRLTKEQESFLRMIREYGGIAIVARDIDGAIADIRTALAKRETAVEAR
jgi:hypothetical protein